MRLVEDAFFVTDSNDINSIKKDFFLGYAICDDAIVLGQAGAEQYQERCRRPVPLHEDGCYVTVQKHMDQSIVIGTDHAGIMPVFYFSGGSEWLVSNSFVLLVEEMRKRGHAVHIDWVTFSMFASGQRTFFGYETVVKGVRLLPSTARLVANDDGLREEPVNFLTPLPYKEGLAKGISKWMSAIAAVANSPEFKISVDLSGGVDSRTSFAFYARLAADKVISKADFELFTGGGRNPNNRQKIDAEVAQNVATVKGYDLSRRRISDYKLSQAQIFERWRLRQLGFYSEVVISNRRNNSTVFSGGFGGEYLRPSLSTHPFLAGIRSLFIMSPNLFFKWCHALVRVARCVKSHSRHRNVSMNLYQEFWGRSHFSVSMSQQFRLEPLTGKDFQRAIAGYPNAILYRRQVFYDIMKALDADLPELPYDKAGKSFSAKCAENRTELSGLKISDIEIYGTTAFDYTPDEQEAPAPSAQGFWQPLLREGCLASKKSPLRHFSPMLGWNLLRARLSKGSIVKPKGRRMIQALYALYLLRFVLGPVDKAPDPDT